LSVEKFNVHFVSFLRRCEHYAELNLFDVFLTGSTKVILKFVSIGVANQNTWDSDSSSSTIVTHDDASDIFVIVVDNDGEITAIECYISYFGNKMAVSSIKEYEFVLMVINICKSSLSRFIEKCMFFVASFRISLIKMNVSNH
jgi:hypothetical protein